MDEHSLLNWVNTFQDSNGKYFSFKHWAPVVDVICRITAQVICTKSEQKRIQHIEKDPALNFRMALSLIKACDKLSLPDDFVDLQLSDATLAFVVRLLFKIECEKQLEKTHFGGKFKLESGLKQKLFSYDEVCSRVNDKF
jgi:hypothetical protein